MFSVRLGYRGEKYTLLFRLQRLDVWNFKTLHVFKASQLVFVVLVCFSTSN